MDTKSLRLKYHNEWPQKFSFPIENDFITLMKSHEVEQGLVTAKLAPCAERQFHFYLGYILDALDMLPLRPDLAFDHLWKALDNEFFIVQQERGDQNCSRFDGFIDKILNDPNAATGFLEFMPLIPYQTCEYGAKRVIEASSRDDNPPIHLWAEPSARLGTILSKSLFASIRRQPITNRRPATKEMPADY